MSIYIYYFEMNNPESTDYRGFSDVGKFTVPSSIFGGKDRIEHQGKLYESSVIMDLSRLCAHDYFLPHGSEARGILRNFLESRLINDSVTPCMVTYIEGEPRKKIHQSIDITTNELHELFDKPLKLGILVKIRKSLRLKKPPNYTAHENS